MLLIHPTMPGVTFEAHGSAAVAHAVKAGWVKPTDAEAEDVPESTPGAAPDAAGA